MRRITEQNAKRKQHMEEICSGLGLSAAATAFLWVPILMGQGPLSQRLLGVGIILLLLLPGIILFILAAAFLYVAIERHEEKEKGELDDAKNY